MAKTVTRAPLHTILQNQTALRRSPAATVEGLFARTTKRVPLRGGSAFGGVSFRGGSPGPGALTAATDKNRDLYLIF